MAVATERKMQKRGITRSVKRSQELGRHGSSRRQT
jgi:hypothetical protein